jgi:plasmid stabilization system protein ParE
MRIIWARPARNDLIEIAEHYRDIAPDFVDSVADRVEVATIPLLAHPHIGSEIGDSNVRKWTVRGTPFILLYVVRGREVEIRRVRHAASNWRDG